MKVSLIVTTFNRPTYLAQCFRSLLAADLSALESIIIVDDGSTDPQTKRLIFEFEYPKVNIIRMMMADNKGIKRSLLVGYKQAFLTSDIAINLDADAVVRPDFIEKLLWLKNIFKERIVSGFNTTVLNRNPIIRTHRNYFQKKYASGINIVINKEQYTKYVEPALNKPGNWDFESSKLHMADGLSVIVHRPSLLQHIGFNSAMGHAVGEPPDVAEDFWLHELKNVTLIGVSCTNLAGLIKAADISSKYLKFWEVKLLSSQPSDDPRVIKINPIRSKADYNIFVMKTLLYYVNTKYFIIFQPDGYLVNPFGWTNEFLKYDMIGAWWNWYNENQCGNGGFSFRSRKLHQILHDDPRIVPANDHLIKDFEEDHNIGRIWRLLLETEYKIKYAPYEVCEKFSIENYKVNPPNNKYKGSLGFHGYGWIDWSEANIEHIPTR